MALTMLTTLHCVNGETHTSVRKQRPMTTCRTMRHPQK